MNNTLLAEKIIEFSGSKDNIVNVTHCMTRLRIRVKNEQFFLGTDIQNLEGVLNIVEQNNEHQIVIGPKVGKVYREVISQLGIEPEQEFAEDASPSRRKIGIEKLMNTISAIFVPLIGIIAAGGTLKGLLALVTQMEWLSTDSSSYILLYGLANAIFYFFPVMLGFTTAKKFNGNPYLGGILGAAMIYPSIVELASSDAATSLFGINFSLMDYSTTVLPIIFGAWLLVKCQKFFEKHLPSVTQIIFVPMLSLLISFSLVMLVIGPVMTLLNDGLCSGVMFIYDFSPILAGAVLGGIWQATILMGIGWGFVPIFLGNIMTLGYCPIIATLAASSWSQTGAAFAAGIRSKNKKFKAIGLSAAFSGVMGVTEPAIYGINFPAKKPFAIGLISGAIGGMIAAAMGAKQYAIGPNGIFQAAVFINPEQGIDSGFIAYLVSIVVSFILAFILTYFFGYKNTILEQKEQVQEKADELRETDIELSNATK